MANEEPLSKEVIEALERLEWDATPAPWPPEYVQGAVRHISRNVDPDAFCTPRDRGDVPYDPEHPESHRIGFWWDRQKDGPLIAATRNALPRLLASARREQRYANALEYLCGAHGLSADGVRAFAKDALGERKP